MMSPVQVNHTKSFMLSSLFTKEAETCVAGTPFGPPSSTCFTRLSYWYLNLG